MNATCPECQNLVELKSEDEVGDVVICPNCGAELEVTSLEPPEVELLEEGK